MFDKIKNIRYNIKIADERGKNKMNFELLYTDAAHTPEIVGANDVNNKAGRYDFTTVCYEIYFSEYGGTRSLYFFQGGVTREITIEKGKIYLIPPKIRHIDEVTKTSEDCSGFILFLKFHPRNCAPLRNLDYLATKVTPIRSHQMPTHPKLHKSL